jgi:hypothetical protein
VSKFLDGPASGVCLKLRRAPIFLRVVRKAAGKWDALDQLDDEPEDMETVYVYRLVPGTEYHAHVWPSPLGLSGWISGADYEFISQQPNDGEIRSIAAWRAWVETQANFGPLDEEGRILVRAADAAAP